MKGRIRFVLLVLAVLACFAFGFTWRDLQRGETPSARAVETLFGLRRTASDLAPEQVFRRNYAAIQSDYVGKVDPVRLKYAGIGGMMGSLGDPHTTFFPPRAAKAFNDETRANFFGIGARLQPNSGGAKVFTVFEESPAARAGLKAGDLITHVDGVKVSGKAVDAIVDRVKGPEGTMVRLTVQREGEKAPKVITVKRARIFAPTVENVKVLPGANVGYLAMSSFSEPTMSQFTKALGTLEKQPLQGLVIDLRGNGGGLLETARDLLSLFVEDKVVVKMKMRGRKEEVLRTFSNSTRDFRYPVVILVNEESASAAEIFAGCLKDYGRATLVGEHTYGKASVQNVFPLIDRASAKITIAKYMLPATADISRKVDEDGLYVSGGIAPDVEVKLDPNLADFTQGDPKNDPQLQKALEIIAAKR